MNSTIEGRKIDKQIDTNIWIWLKTVDTPSQKKEYDSHMLHVTGISSYMLALIYGINVW